MLTIYTSRIAYAGPDRLDVTRMGKDPLGIAFAPTWEILRPALAAMKSGSRQVDGGDEDGFAVIRDAWARHVFQYTTEMRISAGMESDHPRWDASADEAWKRGCRPHTEAWAAVLARHRVVLICFCGDPAHCHRRLLARFFVAKGAVDGGEVEGSQAVTRWRCKVDGCGRPLFLCPSGTTCEAGHGSGDE